MNIPDFITHYNRGEPFRSISSVPKNKLPEVFRELNETNAWGLNRFSDPEYLERRIAVEQKIRNEFIAKGGKPALENPIYFFLGRSVRFEEHPRNKSYVIKLNDVPKDLVSFSYGDSMFSFNEDYCQQKREGYLSELCPRVYAFEELPQILSHSDYKAQTRLHIEAQLWVIPSDAMFCRCD